MSPLSWRMEFRRPAVFGIVVVRLDSSRQVVVSTVEPVHRHMPLIHIPFLLQ